jgi:hypothetical protein
VSAKRSRLSPPTVAGTQTGQITKLQTRARDNLVRFFLTSAATDEDVDWFILL